MTKNIGIKMEAYKKQGIQLWVEGETLKFKGEKKALSVSQLEEIKKQKEEIIAYFKNRFALTPIQQAYFIGGTYECELGNINAQYYVEYRHKNIVIEKMERAVNEIINKNMALKTMIDSQGYQRELSDIQWIKIPVKQLNSEEELEEIRQYWQNYKYEYDTWPMLHFQISKFEKGNDVFHVSFDCIILDAWSAKLMMDEIFQKYNGNAISYPQITFRKYLELSKDYLAKNQTIPKADKYWKERVSEMPGRPIFKMEKNISVIKKPHFRRIASVFTKEETKQLYAKIKKYYFTPAAVICTVYAKTLKEYCVNQNFTLNVTLFNRNPVHEDVDKILGDFTNIGFVSYFGENNRSLIDEMKDMQMQLWKMVQYRMYDGTKILKSLGQSLYGKAIMPVVFTGVLQGNIEEANMVDASKDFKESYAISQTPQVMLDHQARDDGGALYLSWDYVQEAFVETEIEKAFHYYISFLKALINQEWNEISNILSKEVVT